MYDFFYTFFQLRYTSVGIQCVAAHTILVDTRKYKAAFQIEMRGEIYHKQLVLQRDHFA